MAAVKKFKLDMKVSPYGISDKTYVFVNKTDDSTFKALHEPYSCKDYTHEFIASVIHKKTVGMATSMGHAQYTGTLDKLQIVTFLNVQNDEARKQLLSIKNYFNSLEKAHNIKRTLISEVALEGGKKTNAFLLTFSEPYIRVPSLFHAFYAYFRTLSASKTLITEKNIKDVIKEDNLGRDIRIIRFIEDNDLLNILMKHHEDICGKLDLKDIYPPERTNPSGEGYHSGFGMVALASRCLTSLAYSNEVEKILTKYKIPKF